KMFSFNFVFISFHVTCKLIGSSQPVHATDGGEVILPCWVDPTTDVTDRTVDWKKGGADNMVHTYRNGMDDESAQENRFKGRTALFLEKMTTGNLSLKLSNVTMNDSGTYTCSLRRKAESGSCSTDIVLHVGEHIHATDGGEVILPCWVDPRTDVRDRTVEWKKDKVDIVHVYRHGADDDDLQKERFRGRTSLFHDEMATGNLSLKLSNVTMNDSGTYRCSLRRNATFCNTSIVLHVGEHSHTTSLRCLMPTFNSLSKINLCLNLSCFLNI
uniref:Ig-like domain-containing protein n=1 Tax=Myripristis murdjan TaxID=586833 RepID=A0A667X2Y5_9TELE